MSDAQPNPPAETPEQKAEEALDLLREAWKKERTTMFQRAVLAGVAAIIHLLMRKPEK